MNSTLRLTLIALTFLKAIASAEDSVQRLMLWEHTNGAGLIKALPEALKKDTHFTAAIIALAAGYPKDFTGVEIPSRGAARVCFANGRSFVYDDTEQKTFEQKLDRPDIKDTFSQLYLLTNPTDHLPENFDPGRFRIDAMFMAIYGDTASAVAANCSTVEFCGNKVLFNQRNGAADALRKVNAELAEMLKTHPELKPWFEKLAGTFNWRKVAGSEHLSTHSFGVAIDLNVEKSAYWRWKPVAALATFSRLDFPQLIIEAFERHQFIWGGKWFHFDTMHFEYRPELFAYARAMQERRTDVKKAAPAVNQTP